MRKVLLARDTTEAELRADLATAPDVLVVELGPEDAACADRIASLTEAAGATRIFLKVVRAPEPDELRALMRARPHGFWLSDTVGRAGLEQLAARVAVAEAELGILDGSTGIVASIGSAAGALALQGLAEAGPRLTALAWDAEELARDLGLPPSQGAPAGFPQPCRVVRGMLVLVARAAGVPAIETACPHQSGGGLTDHGRLARRDGFSATVARGRRQLEVLAALSD